jgi:predicted transcriptional regulator
MATVSNTFKVRTNTIQERVFEVMKHNPNKTSRDLHEIVSDLTLQNVSAAVNALRTKGLVTITGEKSEVSGAGRVTTHRCYSVDFGKTNKAVSSVPSNVQPDLFGQLIETLNAEVEMLQQWREAAILRYPDLDIDPLLLEARALLAAEAERQGSKPASHNYINGNRDNTIAVQALVKALGNRK